MGNIVRLANGGLRHVIGYQNTAQNLHDGPNAMILPIPAANELGPRSFLDTSRAPHILADMVASTTIQSRGLAGGGSFGAPMTVFDHGVYSIAVGREVTEAALTEALALIPERRRPQLNWDVLGAYPELYPGSTLAILCYDAREATEAGPLLYHYQPLDPTTLFLPALDAHTGRRPVPGELVIVDHDILVGSDTGAEVDYRDNLGILDAFLPRRVLRCGIADRLPNGDFTVDTAQLANGTAQAVRTNSTQQYTLTRHGS
jgi:hypothetical protein